MRKVLKYPLRPGVDKTITLSADSHVVLVAEQEPELVTVWIETGMPCDTEKTYAILGTGHPIPKGATHNGSAICGQFVWHIYEL